MKTLSETVPSGGMKSLVSFAAKELAPQGRRAMNGMIEVMKFYALVAILKADAETHGVKSHGGNKPRGGRPSSPADLKAIFAKYAPELPKTSAHRLYEVGCGIAAQYEQIVGAKFAKQFALPSLVTSNPKELPEPARKKQQALFDHVSGTSQKSWLDQYRPRKFVGGNHHPQCGKCGKNLGSKAVPVCPDCGQPTGAPRPDLSKLAEEGAQSLVMSAAEQLFKIERDTRGTLLWLPWRVIAGDKRISLETFDARLTRVQQLVKAAIELKKEQARKEVRRERNNLAQAAKAAGEEAPLQ